MKTQSFEDWFANHLGEEKSNVSLLLQNKTPLHFLIACSLFESICFDRYMRVLDVQPFAKKLVEEYFDTASIEKHGTHFHSRYKADKTLFKQLMHKTDTKEMERILNSSYVELAKFDIIFFTTFVVLRFRNNIFHGNKYARNWMKYKDQIIHCTEIMQLFISHADSIRKSKNADATA